MIPASPAETAPSPAETAPRRRDVPTLTWRDLIVCLLLVVASLATVAVHVPKHDTVSPIDEYVYIDYYAKVLDQGVVVRGEETGEYARQYLACHGVRAIGYYPEALCATAGEGRDSAYPNAGTTSVEAYTPLYFGITRVLAQPLTWFGVDLTDAGRAVGGLWLAAGVVLLYLALRRHSVSRWVGLGLGLLVVGSLPAYWSNTYISTDATSILAGALMLLVAGEITRTSKARWIVGISIAAAVVTAFKLQNFFAVVVVALWLLIAAGVEAWRDAGGFGPRFSQWIRDRRSIAALSALAAGVVVEVVWILIGSVLAIGASANQGIGVPPTLRRLMNDAFKTLPGVSQGALSPADAGPTGFAISVILTLVIVGGVIGLVASARSGSRGELLAISTLVVSFIGLPIFAIANIVVSGGYFEMPSRYGIALIPAMVFCAGLLFSGPKRWLGPATVVVGATSFALALMLRG